VCVRRAASTAFATKFVPRIRFRSKASLILVSGHVILTGRNTSRRLNSLSPDINGPISKAAVRNADNNLKQILEFIDKDRDLATNTDILMRSAQGFGMISKQPIEAIGVHVTQSFAGP
jgi:hypothetical protein